ncbi:MAG: GNAT family N-acetyltransferase [Clostridia bacterium]|nr:GNAT family N-acetyltransferase [Clostridia bacterium]
MTKNSMAIRYEDPEFEKEILEGGSCLAVPAEISLSDEDGAQLLVYSICSETAQEFSADYSSDPFSDEAIAFLNSRLAPEMEKWGFTLTDARSHAYLEFRCSKPDTAKILPDCEIIASLDREKWDNLELDEFELDESDPTDRMAVIRRKGKIVCFAGLNDLSEDGLFELNVECEEAYRRKGFAASCIAALTAYLLGLGEDVKYVTSVQNEASRKTAQAAGFRLYKKVLPFVCHRELNEEGEEF